MVPLDAVTIAAATMRGVLQPRSESRRALHNRRHIWITDRLRIQHYRVLKVTSMLGTLRVPFPAARRFMPDTNDTTATTAVAMAYPALAFLAHPAVPFSSLFLAVHAACNEDR